MCVLTNERYKTYQTGFLFCRLGHVPEVGLWGTGGAQGVKKNFKHGHVAYQIDGRVPTSTGKPGKPGKSQKKVPCMEKSWNLKKTEKSWKNHGIL